MTATAYPKIGRGKRALVVGRTGMGKSTLANWLLQRSPGHWVVLNPKWTKSYDKLPDSVTVQLKSLSDYSKIESEIYKHKFVIVNPSSSMADHETLDDLIMWMHERFSDIGLVVDELYMLHNQGRAGDGLQGWLTRGRELHQSFLGLTQRPAWLSHFLFSESDYIGGMSLSMEDDRKRMTKMTGMVAFEKSLPPHYWRWFDVARQQLRTFGPVPLPIDNPPKSR